MGVISSLLTRVSTRNLPNYRNESVIERVMDEKGVEREVAEKWFEEALFFLDLCAREKSMLSPPPRVDDAWHAFILHTPDYARYCDHRFGRFIHHQPMRDPNPDAYLRAYELRQKLDRPVDRSIWPPPLGRGDQERHHIAGWERGGGVVAWSAAGAAGAEGSHLPASAVSDQQRARRGWFARWREHRLDRRQRALERWYLDLDRARASGESRAPAELSIYATGSSSDSVGLVDALGGGGGGCGGGCGGG